MSKLSVTGRVITDLELKLSTRKVPYTRFTLCERVGFGDSAHPQYIQVWAWGEHALQLVNSGIKSGSYVWATGSLELEEYVKLDGKTRDKRLKLKLTDWGVATRNTSPPAPATAETILCAVETIDGEREVLPE